MQSAPLRWRENYGTRSAVVGNLLDGTTPTWGSNLVPFVHSSAVDLDLFGGLERFQDDDDDDSVVLNETIDRVETGTAFHSVSF